MTILGSAKYRIEHYSDNSCAPPEAVYVDCFENLRHVIATTWMKIPHTVAIEGMDVRVFKEGTKNLLAQFTFKPLDQVSLPDHL